MIVLSHYLFNNLGLAIIILTVIIRAAMYPLTMKQLKASKAMQSIQGQMAELQKKYARDKQTLAREQMKLYRQTGMNPAGCLLPTLVQMPIWIALYQAIIRVLGAAPEDFLNLSQHLYSSWPVFSMIPVGSSFFWLDLALPDRLLVLPLMVGATMWVQQKMMTGSVADPRMQAQTQMMNWMMPMMFIFLSLSFPSGLALYWVASNLISIVMQYYITGWGGLAGWAAGLRPKPAATQMGVRPVQEKVQPKLTETTSTATPDKNVQRPAQEEETGNGSSGDKRQDGGGSNPPRPGASWRNPRQGGSHRRKGG